MTATRTDLTLAVLEKLYVARAGETVHAEDAAVALRIIDRRTEYLRDKELAYWANDEIPDGIVDPLAEYLTFYFAPVFVPEEDETKFYNRSQLGLKDMRETLAKRSQGASVQVDYF
jgi:hypothetical protein